MSLQAIAHVPALPGNVTSDNLQTLREGSAAREALLRRIISSFEQKYDCSLDTFEQKLANREAPEHPSWEDSIEWRNAVEELEQARVSQSIFAWLDNLLVQSAAS